MCMDLHLDLTLVYVAYNNDLPNLYLSLCSVKSNWTGSKNILIIEDNQDLQTNAKSIVDNVDFDSSWNIQIIPGEPLKLTAGWDRQQIYKLLSQIYTNTTWSLILDCKNILFKKEDGSSFLTPNCVVVQGTQSPETIYNDAWAVDFARKSKSIVNGKDTNIYICSITPFVFNKQYATELLSLINYKELTHLDFTEFFLYWYYTNTKLPYKERYILAGAWGNFLSIEDSHVQSCIFFNMHRFRFTDDNLMKTLTALLLQNNVVNVQQLSTYYNYIYNRR